MATNSVTAALQLLVTLGGGGSINGVGSQQLTQAGTHSLESIQSIATSATAVSIGSCANIGFIFIQNLDPTNYVEVDIVNTFNSWPQKLLPGGPGIFLCPEGTAVFAKAHTGACDCKVVVCEL